jgi:hypothetical protein
LVEPAVRGQLGRLERLVLLSHLVHVGRLANAGAGLKRE